jgi:hypothetical protein
VLILRIRFSKFSSDSRQHVSSANFNVKRSAVLNMSFMKLWRPDLRSKDDKIRQDGPPVQ